MVRLLIVAALVVVTIGHARAPTRQGTETLKIVLASASEISGCYTVAIPLLEMERVRPSPEPLNERTIEPFLRQIVTKLSLPARLIKLYLPRPPKGRNWTAEELLTYANAEARLYNAGVGEPKPGTVEIMSQELAPERARPAIEALDLRPVYVITLAKGHFGGVWQTTYGEMHLEQRGARITGVYRTNGGRIVGNIVGNELRFQWFEETSGTSGYGFLKLSDDAMSFSGPWYNDPDPNPAGVWTGRRIAPPK